MTMPFFVISRYNEDISWIKQYTKNYIVYNKGDKIKNNHRVVDRPNIGGNQFDIFYFIVENYNRLPDMIAFVQAYPWDHCNKEKFDRVIQNTYFTPLEYYGNTPANSYESRSPDGGYLEINNNWFIDAHNKTTGKTCHYKEFDDFMYKYFSDYVHQEWLRFSPGSQYLVEKRQCLMYPISFWKDLMSEINTFNSTEAHIIERSLLYIFTHRFRMRQ